jgi:hypothetical protein
VTLRSVLRAVWDNQDPLARYTPRSTGGTAWKVFDRAADRFLSDEEAKAIKPMERMKPQ